jgi:hypothetical protein
VACCAQRDWRHQHRRRGVGDEQADCGGQHKEACQQHVRTGFANQVQQAIYREVDAAGSSHATAKGMTPTISSRIFQLIDR